MNITPDPEFKAKLLEKIAQREFSERTGTHITDLLYCLNKQAMRRLSPKPNSAGQLLLFSLGWSTQRWLTGKDEDEPEREVDGVKVTLDAVDEGNPWELKATYQANTKPIEENIAWVRQVMAQCYVTGTKVAHLSRLEIMGNWKWVYKPKTPVKLAEIIATFGENWEEHPTLTAVRLEFTQKELDEFWAWAKHRRDQFEGVLKSKKLLPKLEAIASGMAFECDYCDRKEECERGTIG